MPSTKINYLEILNRNYKKLDYYDVFFLKWDIDFTGKKILDYGSGNGKLFEYLIEKKWVNKDQLYGVDIEQSHLDYIKEHVWVTNLSLVDLETQKTTLEWGQFDVIFCLDIIEHSERPDDILIELKRLLKDDGTIVLCTPNRLTRYINLELFHTFKLSNWWKITKFNFLRLFWREFLDPTHVMEYFPWQFKTLIKRHNLIAVKSNYKFTNYLPFLSISSFIVHLKK